MELNVMLTSVSNFFLLALISKSCSKIMKKSYHHSPNTTVYVNNKFVDT